jgi:protein involved in polysaccharide export with SLBB domain
MYFNSHFQFNQNKLKMSLSNINRLILIFLISFSFSAIVNGQITIPNSYVSAQKGLDEKGISEEQLKLKLSEKGVDIDNISPDDIQELEGTIQQAIEEIEAENGQNTGNGVVEDLSVNNELSKEDLDQKFDNLDVIEIEDVETEIGEGQSIEEAISDFDSEDKGSDQSGIYGHSIFFDESLDFYKKSKSSSTPDHYILDVGDKITINIFGLSQADLIYQIENDGFIRPSGMYKIYLKGLNLVQARKLLFKRFQQAYSFKKGEFNLDVNTARTVSVSIYGEVQHPGTYTMSALNSTLNAIIAAGGPTKDGSIREIQLTSGREKYEIDVYDFLSQPSSIINYGLRNSMVIFIPPSKQIVTLSGPFLHTGRFEMKESETLSDLILIAGGIKKGMVLKNFNMIRNNGLEDSLNTYNFEKNKDIVLEDLDRISFMATSRVYDNYVKISGAIRYPGEYEFSEGVTLKSLLNEVQLEEFARTDIGYLTRRNLDGTVQLISFSLDSNSKDITLQKQDEIFVFNQRSFVRNYTFSISGAVAHEKLDHYVDDNRQLRLSDAILLAGGLQDNAANFAYITRRSIENSKKLSYKIIPISDVMSNPKSRWNFSISPYDKILIPTTENFTEQQFIEVKGAVRNPQKLVYDKSLKLKDLLLRAGGLNFEASSNRVDIFRLEINENKPTRTLFSSVSINRELDPSSEEDRITLKPFDIVVVREVPDFDPIQLVNITGEVMYPGQYAITLTKERVSDLIVKAGGLTEDAFLGNSTFKRSEDGIGFVAVNFKKAINNKNNHNLLLSAGDLINIGKEINLVSINHQGTNADEFMVEDLKIDTISSAPYTKNKRSGYYIRRYTGGFSKDAKPSKTFVKYADGRFLKTHNFLIFRVHRKVKKGSKIIVGMKDVEEKENSKRRRSEKSKINLKDAAMELMSVVVSAFTVITMAQNL